MKLYSRKQMGVIYRAVKEGNISLTGEQISYLYDCADCYTNDVQFINTMHYGMKIAINAIFEGDFEQAKACIEDMLNA